MKLVLLDLLKESRQDLTLDKTLFGIQIIFVKYNTDVGLNFKMEHGKSLKGDGDLNFPDGEMDFVKAYASVLS